MRFLTEVVGRDLASLLTHACSSHEPTVRVGNSAAACESLIQINAGQRSTYKILLLTGPQIEGLMTYSPDFSLDIGGVKGVCPAGERWAEQQISEDRIPVFSCEGPCIRGEIARLAANQVAREKPYARACHAETFFVPHSGMARWAKGAKMVVVIDGCFLKCHGRALANLVGAEKLVQFDVLKFYKKYTDVFLMDDVPENERKDVARGVAEKISAMLKDDEESSPVAAA
jgi:uncharacterized metal-binding protein